MNFTAILDIFTLGLFLGVSIALAMRFSMWALSLVIVV